VSLLDLKNHRNAPQEDCEFVLRKDTPSKLQIGLSIAAALETSVIAKKVLKIEQR
jgi:hypothetical protein